ncbi:MAG: hypothetical protein IJ168_02900 [Eubacterium sp.]|nr:hypothetical protein [Eubacterium sp.]
MKPNVVYVSFGYGKIYPYLNDRFDLAVGDKVYVDGKLAGQVGEVTEVLTQFKVNLKYYKYVLAKLDFNMEGTYKKFDHFVVGTDVNAVPFDKMLAWIQAPPSSDDEEDEFIYGDGYTIDLATLDKEDDEDEDAEGGISGIVYYDGQELAENGELKFISVMSGVGKAALMHKDKIKTVDFRFDGEKLTELFCTCITPRLCEDMAAVAYVINEAIKALGFESTVDFSVIEEELFDDVTKNTNPTIII